jgi:hypothetical protein
VLNERSRLIALLGIGGIGKTALAARLAQHLAPRFQRIYWRSLGDAPPVAEWQAGAIGFLSDQRLIAPEAEAAQRAALLQLLQLTTMLEHWRGRPEVEQGYGPGNLANLLRLWRGDLRRLDLSRLVIRQAYLAEVEAQDASLADARHADSVLADSFTYPVSMALSPGGGYLVARTTTGEAYVWRVADRTLVAVVRGQAGGFTTAALNTDGSLLATGGEDGTVRLWDVATTQLLLATLGAHEGGVRDVAFGGARLLATCGIDGSVRVWDLQWGRTRDRQCWLRRHCAPVGGRARPAAGDAGGPRRTGRHRGDECGRGADRDQRHRRPGAPVEWPR